MTPTKPTTPAGHHDLTPWGLVWTACDRCGAHIATRPNPTPARCLITYGCDGWVPYPPRKDPPTR